MVERRPSPEELLRRVQAEERRERRGSLKVFLGYASRVGKSYRMLDEGRRRKMRGEDVVVAATQPGNAPEVEELLAKLERVPSQPVPYGGRQYDVLDIPAIFRRRPSVCIVDGLAYDNPPGSRNPKRWQDVEELLENGIGVITAVNLQHIEEKQEAVERITGRRATQAVPEGFLREANEIEVVDAALDSLVERGCGEEDLRRVGELRELALLLAADVVDHQLREYLASHGIEQVWGTHESILVCLTPRSNARRMLESGKRNADRFHGQLLAAYVRQPGASAADEQAIQERMALAKSLGAEVHCLEGPDFVRSILAFAHAQGVTQIFLGHSLRENWLHRLRGSPLDRLIEGAADMDVRVFPHEAQP